MIRNSFLRPVVALGVATPAVILATAGLAVAGVDLPDPAAKAFENAGISLPNQAGGGEDGGDASSGDVRSVIEATPSSERDCAFGQRVAEAAKGSPLPEQARAACDRDDQNGDTEGSNGAPGGNSSHGQFGHDTADRARGLRDATVDERRSFGEDTAGRARELGGAPGQAPATERPSQSPPAGGTTGPPDGIPTPPEDTSDGPPDAAPVPPGTPAGPPSGTPGGRP